MCHNSGEKVVEKIVLRRARICLGNTETIVLQRFTIVIRLSSKPHWSGNIRSLPIRLRQFNATAMRRLATQNIS